MSEGTYVYMYVCLFVSVFVVILRVVPILKLVVVVV